MSQALKVGIFGVIALVVLAYLILQVEQWSPFAPEGVRCEIIVPLEAPTEVSGASAQE